WDGWPDGSFERTFSHEELVETKQLQVHWACTTSGVPRSGGSVDAEEWTGGRKSERRCQGIIKCDNPHCAIVIRPKATPSRIARQLAHSCTCGGKLARMDESCPARQYLWKFKHGTHFTLHGPGQPASEISPVLLNKDRIKYEQRKIKQTTAALSVGDQFLSAFSRFCEDHAGFVLQSVIGPVSVISVQTATLRGELVKDAPLSGSDGNLNGIVSDAAHGFWRDRSALLIISSTFSPRLRCWVPGIFSYANGASSAHYKLHFLALFQSMAYEARLRNVPIDDALFSNVVDFSEAEHTGFTDAFVEFWRREGTTRTADDLRSRAKALLKGCQQHFRAGVTRLKRLGGVI
ncbi:hypothetical protein FKP32DRAFT_1547654, partial [Trametes sanguinea]